jgi:hypothetical protein
MYTEKIFLAEKRELAFSKALRVTDRVQLLKTGVTDGRTWALVSFIEPMDLFRLGIAYMSAAAEEQVDKAILYNLN